MARQLSGSEPDTGTKFTDAKCVRAWGAGGGLLQQSEVRTPQERT